MEPLFQVRHIDAQRGDGLFAARALPAGTRLFEEYPLVAMQHGDNRRKGVKVCERCFRFLGPLDEQMRGLLRGRGAAHLEHIVPSRLPVMMGASPLCNPVACPGGCDLRFCSSACANAHFYEHHRLLCPCAALNAEAGTSVTPAQLPTPPPTTVSPAASKRARSPHLEDQLDGMQLHDNSCKPREESSMRTDDSELKAAVGPAAAGPSNVTPAMASSSSSSSSMAFTVGGGDDATVDEGGGLESLGDLEPLPRFEAHARATNEIFLLAARAVALVLCRLEGGSPADMQATYEAAMSPFAGSPKWWDAVAIPDDVTDEVHFRRTLKALLLESWTLLAAVLGRHAPAGCALFTNPDAYATIVGAFERRNCTVAVASVVEAYFLEVDALPSGPERDAILTVTQPILDALDDSYATPFDGTGLFPLQATMNHSCEPNVTLLKEAEEEEDGRVVARLTRDVAEGEELCNAYVDISLPVRRRRRELREYGFECDCPRCVRELAAANEKKAAKTSGSGKRRLK